MSRRTPTFKQAGRRYRGWSIVSTYMTADEIRRFISDHAGSSMEIVGAVHDQDPGVATHGHLFLYDPYTARTAEAVKRLFDVPVVAKPYIIPPDLSRSEFGPITGKFALVRAARYLTHEHPLQAAQGKALYLDGIMLTSANFADWRARVDELNMRERLRPGGIGRLTTLQAIEDRVRTGELTARGVHRSYRTVFALKSDAHWRALERQADDWAREERAETERAERAAELAEREAERLSRAEAEQQAQHEHEHREAAERAKEEAVRVAREAAEREATAERRAAEEAHAASPEGIAEANLERVEAMLNVLAVEYTIAGSPAARSLAMRATIAEEHEEYGDGPLPSVAEFYADNYGLKPDQIDGDLKKRLLEISRVSVEIARVEWRAAEGDSGALDGALALRRKWAGYPDLVDLPPVRPDLPKAAREQLTSAVAEGIS